MLAVGLSIFALFVLAVIVAAAWIIAAAVRYAEALEDDWDDSADFSPFVSAGDSPAVLNGGGGFVDASKGPDRSGGRAPAGDMQRHPVVRPLSHDAQGITP